MGSTDESFFHTSFTPVRFSGRDALVLEMWRLVGRQPTCIEVKGSLAGSQRRKGRMGFPCLCRKSAESSQMEIRRCFWSPRAHPDHEESLQQQVQTTSSHPRRQPQGNWNSLGSFAEALVDQGIVCVLGANFSGGCCALFVSARKTSICHDDRNRHFPGCFPLPQGL